VIVADTGAIVALIDRKDQHHRTVRPLFEEAPDQWVLPWAILPEVDYLLAHHVGVRAQGAPASVPVVLCGVLWPTPRGRARRRGRP
jgi:predicted nucleic acid-binding protein